MDYIACHIFIVDKVAATGCAIRPVRSFFVLPPPPLLHARVFLGAAGMGGGGLLVKH